MQEENKEKERLIPIDCPKCGGRINVKEGQRVVECGYCDYSFVFDDGIERKEVTHKYIHEHTHYNIDVDPVQFENMLMDRNDALWEQKALEQEREYERALLAEQRRERKVKFIAFIVIMSVITVLGLIFKSEITEAFGAIGAFLSNAIVWVCIIVIVILAIVL